MFCKRNYVLVVVVLLSNILFAQQLDTITWRESYRLNWADFKGVPQPGRPEGAITSVEFIYGVFGEERKIECVVMCYFNRELSWGIDKYKNDYVLSHEQGHFDLYELKARKLREKLSKKSFNRETLEKDIQEIAEEILKEAEQEQKAYDKETGFGIQEENQKKWSKKISEDLQKPSKYKNSRIILNVK